MDERPTTDSCSLALPTQGELLGILGTTWMILGALGMFLDAWDWFGEGQKPKNCGLRSTCALFACTMTLCPLLHHILQ